MASIAAIRDGVKTTLEANISGLRVYDTIPEVAHTPAVVVMPARGNFNVTMGRGFDTFEFDLYVLVGRSVARVAQDTLDGYLSSDGATSIREVIFGNSTLGVSETNATVTGFSSYGAEFETAAVEHIGAVLSLVVHTKGNG